MYYHFIIEKKPEQKSEKKFSIYTFDLDKETLISNYVKPYLKNNNFIVNGYTLTQKNISRFKIVVTEAEAETLADKKKKEYSRSGFIGFCRREDVLNDYKLAKDVTQEIFEEVDYIQDNDKTEKLFDGNYIFIVHGHNINKVTEIENYVRSIGYEPIVLFKEADVGDTIIEKIEKYSAKSIYAIILYTKCDEGNAIENPNDKKPRARQNVVFEHGYLMAKLGRERVCAILEDSTIETPSDISGIIYKLFDNEGSWKYQVAKNMSAVGISVDFNKIR